MQVKKQQLEPDMEQWTGSRLGKEYIKAVYCHPVYLTSVQSKSCKMLGWMTYRLDSRLPGEITISDMQMITTLMAETEEELKSLLMMVKEESEKAGLKFNIQASGSITSWQMDGEKVETVRYIYFLGLQNHCGW